MEELIKIPEITAEAREKIRNNSVAKLPANVSESGLSAKVLQELFVAPIIGEKNSVIAEYNCAVAQMNKELNKFNAEVGESSQNAAEALTLATATKITAETAIIEAKAANVSAKQAHESAELAKESASSAQSLVSLAESQAANASISASIASTSAVNAANHAIEATETATRVEEKLNDVLDNKIGISQDITSTDTLTAPSSAIVAKALDDLTKPITPVNQKAEVVHLSPTREGYVDELKLSSAPVQVISPNLYNGKFANDTISGVTFIQNENGSILLNGTATDRIIIALPQTNTFFQSGTTMIMGKLVEDRRVDIEYTSVMEDESIEYYPRTDGKAFTFSKSIINQRINLIIINGAVFNNVVIFPMLNLGTTVLPYAPYTGQPSPTNEIPIKVVGSQVEVLSVGNNLQDDKFNFIKYEYQQITVINNLEIKSNSYSNLKWFIFEKNYIKFLKDSTDFAAFSGKYIGLKPYTNYIITFKSLPYTGKVYNIFGLFNVEYNPDGYSFNFTTDYSGSYDFGNYFLYNASTSQVTDDAVFYNFMLNEGVTALPYDTYQSETTSLPLVVKLGDKAGQTAELLGEFNTKTNVLVQNYSKLTFLQVAKAYGSSQDNTETNTIYFNFKPSFSVMDYTSGFCTVFESTTSNIFLPTNVNINKFTTYAIDNTIGVRADRSLFGIEFSDSVETRLQKLNTFFAVKPIIFYIKKATPEVLRLKPTPPVPTLAGTTNIYAINNAAPVMFDVTELLLSQNRRNVVLESTLLDGTKVNDMPRTVSSQVEVGMPYDTLDIELEAIEASISDVKMDLIAEVTAREKGDTDIRTELVDGTLIPQKAVNAENVTTNINGKAITNIFETDGTTVKNAKKADIAVTQIQSDNSTKIATTAYVRQAISDAKNITSGSVTLSAGITAKTNYVRRQVNFVYGEVEGDTLLEFTNRSSYILGTIPEGFRPKNVVNPSVKGFFKGEYLGENVCGELAGSCTIKGEISFSILNSITILLRNYSMTFSKVTFAYEIT